MKMKKLFNDQRGFTLVEMLVVVAIMGIIAAGIAMTISQVMAVNSRTSSHMVALRQVQQAGDRVSKDVLQARSIHPDPSSATGFPLTLTIPYWGEDEDENPVELQLKVRYVLSDDNLQREYYGDGVINGGPDYTTTVARYILSVHPDDVGNIMTSFGPAEEAGAYIFKVSAKVGARIETREYEVRPRPGS